MRVIETDRFRLCPLVAGDSLRMYVPFSDPSLYFFVPTEPPATLGALTERFARLEKRLSPDGSETWLNWVIERRPDVDRLRAPEPKTSEPTPWRQPLGLIEATVFENRQALVGYFTFREFWGQGVASECLEATLDHLEHDYGIRLFRAEADVRNFASIRVLEKCGFHIAETVPQADFFKGHRSDEHRMVKLAG